MNRFSPIRPPDGIPEGGIGYQHDPGVSVRNIQKMPTGSPGLSIWQGEVRREKVSLLGTTVYYRAQCTGLCSFVPGWPTGKGSCQADLGSTWACPAPSCPLSLLRKPRDVAAGGRWAKGLGSHFQGHCRALDTYASVWDLWVSAHEPSLLSSFHAQPAIQPFYSFLP